MKLIPKLVLAWCLFGCALAQAQQRPYLQAARDTARWIRASAVTTRDGRTWPADPLKPAGAGSGLYSGSSGVVLFYLEAYQATHEKTYLEEACAGADHLIAELEKTSSTGLYTGVAGLGFVLTETYKISGIEKYRVAAKKCVKLVSDRAKRSGRGVQWSDTTDIIDGTAGIGLFLLYAADELKDPGCRDLAVQAGRRLLELGKPEAGGTKWAMDPSFPRLMPNFSHGTAGIAYFLATLYRATKQQEFLDAALSGARYLLAVADTTADGCLIFHNEPDGKSLFYLGWCHGPTGTARLFYQLAQATGDGSWLEWMRRSAQSLLASGIPEKQTPGFWNNVSQCCGSAGVAEFFLQMYRLTSREEYRAFVRRVTQDLLTRATRDDRGLRWVQAENRREPDHVVAQTGYMQGAAGIGMWLLHLDEFEQGARPAIRFPDSPW